MKSIMAVVSLVFLAGCVAERDEFIRSAEDTPVCLIDAPDERSGQCSRVIWSTSDDDHG